MVQVIVTLFMLLVGPQLFGQNDVNVIISAKVFSRGGVGYGAEIALFSSETGKTYFSKPLSIFIQRHSVIKNIPTGKYKVFYFQGVPAVQGMESNFEEYFGVLEFETNGTYYLGNYVGRSDFALKSPTIYTIESPEIPDQLIKFLKRKKWIENEEDIRMSYPNHPYNLVIREIAR